MFNRLGGKTPQTPISARKAIIYTKKQYYKSFYCDFSVETRTLPIKLVFLLKLSWKQTACLIRLFKKE